MESSINAVAAPVAPAHAPQATPDLRPSADAAAIARDPQPEVPMPIPASTAQSAAVTESRLAPALSPSVVHAIEKTLKPYGVTILPEGPKGQAQKEKAEASSG